MNQKAEKALVVGVFCLGLFLGGCTTTLFERKATDSDQGTLTQLKADPNKVKVVHSF